jgi:hypothetical protein
LAGALLVFASSRANAAGSEQAERPRAGFADNASTLPTLPTLIDACDLSTPEFQPELFTNAIGECDEPGQPVVVGELLAPGRDPIRSPVSCDDGSCFPQHTPLDATGTHALSFVHPLAILGTTLLDPEPSTLLVRSETAGPRAGFYLRIERPPKRK